MEPWLTLGVFYVIGLGPAIMYCAEIDPRYPLATILFWPIRLSLELIKQTYLMIIDIWKR